MPEFAETGYHRELVLHAELHGKVSPEADSIERSEDVLTSAVFGTLLVAGAWDVIAAWLGAAKPVGGASALEVGAAGPHGYWFWPWLDGAEPDLVMRLGDTLVVIEAKFYASKGGDGGPAIEGATCSDQLVREWRACSPEANSSRYPAALRAAMRECSARRLVYLVRRNRAGHELAQVEASMEMTKDASMYLLTWEHLDEVLAGRAGPEWTRELRQYLEGKKLSAFRGFVNTVVRRAPLGLTGWRRSGLSPASPRFGSSFQRDRLMLLRWLAARVEYKSAASKDSWRHVVRVDRMSGLRALARWSSAFEEGERDG